ncbi:MAG TPA: hypothetical protein VMQ76_07650 [Terracidiphilus sp.]|nr:hypothetical protein [Terracidiphilus sp.]
MERGAPEETAGRLRVLFLRAPVLPVAAERDWAATVVAETA